MRKAILAVAGLSLTLLVLCGCVFTFVVVSDFWRYGVPAMQEQRRAEPTRAPAGAQNESAQTGSDALVRRHTCQACHGPQLRGQQHGLMYAPGLTSSGVAGRWTEAEFITAMRTGNRPDNSPLSDSMPWRSIGQASDAELKQLWAYLQSLP
jgi:cytochrome c553